MFEFVIKINACQNLLKKLYDSYRPKVDNLNSRSGTVIQKMQHTPLDESSNKLDKRLEGLLDQFEHEVEPYDRWSSISMIATPVGIVFSIFLPLLFIKYILQSNSFDSIVAGSSMYWVVAGILISAMVTKIPLFYVDHKKHQISRNKYRPIAGVCMCDLSQLRTHMIRMEKSKTMGERLRHAKLVNYYKHQIGLE